MNTTIALTTIATNLVAPAIIATITLYYWVKA
jgi:hypothetical protein